MDPGAGKTKLFVDCKYTADGETNSVSKDEVNRFISNFHAQKTPNGWTMGILVSNRKFTQFARAAAEVHSDIFLKTVTELYGELFQIHGYLYSSINSYESDASNADYVPLNVTGADVGKPVDLKAFYEGWVNGNSESLLCLLGDFGAGKTTFMRKLHYEAAKAFVSGQSERMPLYIQLREYFDVRDGKELIERFFSTELTSRVPFRIFQEFAQSGRFLLLFDGFDEMGASSDSDVRKRNYLKLNQLLSGRSKGIITCRPAYFVTYDELFDVFDLYHNQLRFIPPPTRGDIRRTRNYVELSQELYRSAEGPELTRLLSAIGDAPKQNLVGWIQLFNPSQIRRYLKNRRKDIIDQSDGELDDRALYDRMSEVYDLEDLAKRPILLKLIVNTLPLFRRDAAGSTN